MSSLSVALATETLSRKSKEVALFVDEIRSERTELTHLFEILGVRPLQSQGNFVLAKTADARWVANACASLGVGIRRFPDREALESWVRVTLPGDSNDFERLKQTLTTVLAPEAILSRSGSLLWYMPKILTLSRLSEPPSHLPIQARRKVP